jgi:hypothetical protein
MAAEAACRRLTPQSGGARLTHGVATRGLLAVRVRGRLCRLDGVTAPSRRVTQWLRMLLAAGSLAGVVAHGRTPRVVARGSIARVVARGRLWRIGLESSA